jgi:uncharacterized cofD-like protein
VRSIRVLPAGAPACAEAVDAVREADLVVLGPGSWFTSVIPHLLLRELRHALVTTRATVVVVLNLVPQAGETEGFSPEELLGVLVKHAPDLRIDAVVADVGAVLDARALRNFTSTLPARLVLSTVATGDNPERHDPRRLAVALAAAIDPDRPQ